MKRSAGIALVVLSFLLPPPAHAARPKLGLKVSTHSGKVPLELELQASVSGIELAQVAGCRVRIDRSYRSPGGEKLLERRELPCSDPSGPPPALSFSKQILLEEPGDYALRLILTPLSGREKAGVVQEVKVYHTIEAGLKETRQRDR
jgi:hypothetical protein